MSTAWGVFLSIIGLAMLLGTLKLLFAAEDAWDGKRGIKASPLWHMREVLRADRDADKRKQFAKLQEQKHPLRTYVQQVLSIWKKEE